MFENMKEKKYVEFFTETLDSFGGVSRGNKKYILRQNINTPFPDSGAYFGCINENEDVSGPYSDLSVVVFPSNESNDANDRWIIAFAVGSQGFKNDYQLVSLPGTRRKFANRLSNDSFIKNDFLNIEVKDGFLKFCDKNSIPETLKNAVEKYQNVVLACSLFDPNDEKSSKDTITVFLAIYASLRNWDSNRNRKMKKNIYELTKSRKSMVDEKEEIKALLKIRRYIVLQGAPGTGKTRMAKEIAAGNTENTNVFFTQFHAETAYSDFIYGITPDVEANSLKYKSKKGVFVQAIERAIEVPEQNVYLIIDEINRANLSNVLGPSFYLFEPSMSESGITIEICPGLSLKKLPDNLYIIATMNTADRSLMVVDFALRRRFAWYTMRPHKITEVGPLSWTKVGVML